MNARTRDFDAVVVGAGSAGSGAALALARAGLRVALLERRTAALAGARWVNAIPAWLFERAGLPVPPDCGGEDPTPMALRFRHRGVPVPALPWVHQDMRELVAGLQRLATEAGVTVLDRVRAVEASLDRTGRPDALALQVEDAAGGARSVTLRARLFVDASGLAGALRRQVPALDRVCPPPAPRDLCAAAQWNCGITDPAGARAFLDRNEVPPGVTVGRMGGHGGFSTLMVTVDREVRHVNLLAGAIADGRNPAGADQLRAFRAAEPWVGPLLFGGGGLIPLRRPYDRFVSPGIALVGDAACQVFPAHASGVGAGLVAGRLLADAVAGAEDPGSLDVLWTYAARFQRELGSVWAMYDGFRHFSQQLGPDDLDTLVDAGLMTRAPIEAAMSQRPYLPAPRDVPAAVRAARSDPALALRLARWGATMAAAWGLYHLYPERPDPAMLRRWSWAVSSLFRESADVPV